MIKSPSAQQRLAGLSADRLKLLDLLRQRPAHSAGDIPVQPRDEAAVIRLRASGAQQRLWFIDRLEGDSPAYHLCVALRVHGELDRPALQAALDALLARHESLRAVFKEVDGELLQEISQQSSFELQIVDLRALPVAQREAIIPVQSREATAARFELASGPLIRARLLQLTQREHVLLIVVHHIVADGWSIGVLLHDVAVLYEAHHEGQSASMEPLRVQYGDYAHWHERRLAAPDIGSQLSYWQEQLHAAAQLLELPADRPRPSMRKYRGDAVRLSLGPELTAEVKAFSRNVGATLAMTLYAAWTIVLSRLSGQEDIVVGMPFANRPHTELEGLVGLFVNTLPLRVRFDDDPSVTALLLRVKEVMLGALAHQDVPFDHIVEALHPTRSLSHSPIFQVMFVLQPEARAPLQVSGLTLTEEDVQPQAAQFDVTLSLQERADGIRGHLVYATDLFDAETAAQWVRCFTSVLSAMMREPERSVSSVPLMSTAECWRMLELFNGAQTPYPQEKLINELFEEQAVRTPEAVAVVCGDRRLTYADLDARANRLAHYLSQRGVRPDDFVGVCLERGADMIVAILGILKAAGAYVPLDPAYPQQRLEYILRDTAPKAVLTQTQLVSRLPRTAAELVELDGDWPAIARQPSARLDCRALGLRSHHLAYVIYTSGSTGEPKGVAIEHRHAVNLIWWARSAQAADVFERTLHSTSLNFDLSVYESFVPLSTGGTLHVVANALALAADPVPVTLINTVPSAIKGVLDSGGIPPGTRVVNLAGEALKKDLVQRIFARSAVECVCNLYGPSETTTYSTWIAMPRRGGFLASIGRPIANTQVYILDRSGQVVPVGVVGEIYIGGAGVARGYLNRPQLTAERFLADPFAADPQARMYRTGDLGRWRSDRTIEYLGRSDHQVKVRGFRIELGEIEAQLARHDAVKEAVVLAREDVPDEKRLVAYVIARDGASGPALSADALRMHLQTALPQYMMPSAFVLLDALPLTQNGKLNRSALPAPDVSSLASHAYAPPEGEVEEAVAAIWRELLHVARVGRHDNFFELGGHSLLATRVVSRLREALQIDVHLTAVFDTPTLLQLSARLVLERDRHAAQETLRAEQLAQHVRGEIDQLDDAAVQAEIARLEQELSRGATGASGY